MAKIVIEAIDLAKCVGNVQIEIIYNVNENIFNDFYGSSQTHGN